VMLFIQVISQHFDSQYRTHSEIDREFATYMAMKFVEIRDLFRPCYYRIINYY